MIKKYYQLTKPGIVYGNLVTTIAAFLFATRWHIHADHLSIAFSIFFATVIGISLVIASACVFNNFLDRDMDAKMKRTEHRALVTGEISVRNALIYGAVLLLVGLVTLTFLVNHLTAVVALFGFISYVIVYGIAKRVSHWGTVVGSISGAVPIVVGYTAVVARIDTEALILFLIMVFWQMPHFYAIAMYRLEEYKAAGIPVLPAQKGMHTTKIHIIAYMFAFILAEIMLWSFGYAGRTYLISILVFGGLWLYKSFQGFRSGIDEAKWAKKTFLFSLIVLVGFCVTIAVAPLLP